MSVGAKIRRIIGGILMILISFLLILTVTVDSSAGIGLIMVFISVWLIVYGIRLLHYYSKMARYMVGGKTILILGFVVMDLGLFTFSLLDVHSSIIILYLLGVYAFSGAIDVMRAFEQRKNESAWKWKLVTGFIEISVALTALVGGVFFRSSTIVVLIFALGIAYSAVARIVDAFIKKPMMAIL